MKMNVIEIERKAKQVRDSFKIDSYGMNNIFDIIERNDIILIRIPLGRNTICGFSTIYNGKKVIVSNSSEILSREIFTVAHELAHCIYDLKIGEQKMLIDTEINLESSMNIEKRADIFAVSFLLPEEKLKEFLKYELRKSFNELNSVDIIRMQIEFHVSYAFLILRLYELNLINEKLKTKLFSERDSKTSKLLFKTMNLNDDLIKPSNILKVPHKYYEYVLSNYKNGYISFTKMKEALDLVDFNTEEIDEIKINTEEELNMNDLIQGF